MISLKGKELAALSGCNKKSANTTKLDVSNNLLPNLEGIESMAELKWLNASHNQIKSIKHLKSCAKINVLNLGNNKLSSTKHLNKLKELNALILNNNELETLDGLAALKELNTLVVSSNKLQNIDLSALKKLQKFSVSRNLLTEFPLLQNQKDMKDLKLNDNKINSIPDWVATSCIRIKIMDLGNNLLEDFKSIECLTKLPFLENLNLKGNPLCDVEDYHLKMKEKFPNLKILDFKKMSELYFAAVLERSKKNEQLKEKSSIKVVDDKDDDVADTNDNVDLAPAEVGEIEQKEANDHDKDQTQNAVEIVSKEVEDKSDVFEDNMTEHNEKKKKRKRKRVLEEGINAAGTIESNISENQNKDKVLKNKMENITEKVKFELNDLTGSQVNVESKRKRKKKVKQLDDNIDETSVKGNENTSDGICKKQDKKIKSGKKKKEETKKTGVVSIKDVKSKKSKTFDVHSLEDNVISFGVGGSCAWS